MAFFSIKHFSKEITKRISGRRKKSEISFVLLSRITYAEHGNDFFVMYSVVGVK